MLPIRDHNPSQKTPYVTYGLMAVNITVFFTVWAVFQNQHAINLFFAKWGTVPVMVTECSLYHTMITSMFLHGGIMHLAGNMLFLWIFGDNMEEQLGHGYFLLFYFVVGIIAAYAHVLAGPLSHVPMIGASGAIAGVMGGYLLLFPKAKIDILLILIVFFRIFAIPAWLMLGIWFGLQLFGVATTNGETGGVAYDAHSGGFLIGLLIIWPLWLHLGGKAFWNKTHGHPPHPEAKYKLVKSRIPKVGNRS